MALANAWDLAEGYYTKDEELVFAHKRKVKRAVLEKEVSTLRALRAS